MASPADPSGYAEAAVLYANGSTGGMTILWGLTYMALAPTESEHGVVAAAIARVLREHVSVEHRDDTHRVSTSLAPGATPVLATTDGGYLAPVAHLFETDFLRALFAFDGTWTVTSASDMVVRWVDATRTGSTLDPHVELLAWLRLVDDAGHLAVLVADLLAPAYPAAESDPDRIAAAHAFVAAHPFVPSHPVLPDDLLPFDPLP